MSSKTELVERVSEKWGGLEPRDRRALIGFACIIVIALLVFIFYKINTLSAATAKETDQYRDALTYIAENRADYAENTIQKEETRKKLLTADSKIVSKLSSMASSLGFDVTVTPKDAHKTSDDSGAEEQEIEVTFKGVDYDKFLDYIIQIHKLETPIYMRHLQMNRTSNNAGEETKMTVTITLISYRLKEQ